MALMASTIMRVRLQASMYAAGGVGRVTQDLADQSSLNAVTAAWALAGATCASGPGCSCVCTLASGACAFLKPCPRGPL